MRRRHVGVALLAALAGLGAVATTEAKKARVPEPGATVVEKVKRLDAEVRDLKRRLAAGGL